MQDSVIRNLIVQYWGLQRRGLRNSRIRRAVASTAHVGRVMGKDETKLTARDANTGSIALGQSDVCKVRKQDDPSIFARLAGRSLPTFEGSQKHGTAKVSDGQQSSNAYYLRKVQQVHVATPSFGAGGMIFDHNASLLTKSRYLL